MKVFWNDDGRGIVADKAVSATLDEVSLIWSDEVRGMEGNFLGLVDGAGRTIQFYVAEDIPDGVDDAGHLEIVDVDFPDPNAKGSYMARIPIRDVHSWIRKAFSEGADPGEYDGLKFVAW